MTYRLYKTEARIVSYFWGHEDADIDELAFESLQAESNKLVDQETTEVDSENHVIEEHWIDGVPYGERDGDNRTVSDLIEAGETVIYDDYEESDDLNFESDMTEDEIAYEEKQEPEEIWKEEL